MLAYVTKKELDERMANGWEIIDVRSPQEFSFMKKIPLSRNIPYPKIVSQMEQLFPDKDIKLIMVCNAGNRSGISVEAYREKGYRNVYYLIGGIEGLQNY